MWTPRRKKRDWNIKEAGCTYQHWRASNNRKNPFKGIGKHKEELKQCVLV